MAADDITDESILEIDKALLVHLQEVMPRRMTGFALFMITADDIAEENVEIHVYSEENGRAPEPSEIVQAVGEILNVRFIGLPMNMMNIDIEGDVEEDADVIPINGNESVYVEHGASTEQ